MFCAILYGEIRTFVLCLPSIKRLFNDILNIHFYVVINKSKNKIHDYEYYEKLIKTNLNVKSYDLCDISQTELCLIQKKKEIYKEQKITTKLISFEDYSKLPFNEKLYTNNEINCIDCEEIELSDKDICNYPYNQYIEDYLINIAINKIPNDIYSHIFRLRTDVIWFDDYLTKQKYLYLDNINNKLCIDEEYNKNICSYNFHNLKEKIMANLNNNSIIISSLNLINNIRMPCAHAQIMPLSLFKKYVEFFNDKNVEFILEQIKKYPVLFPHWGGEMQQKKVFQDLNITINTNFYLMMYHSILRE